MEPRLVQAHLNVQTQRQNVEEAIDAIDVKFQEMTDQFRKKLLEPIEFLRENPWIIVGPCVAAGFIWGALRLGGGWNKKSEDPPPAELYLP